MLRTAETLEAILLFPGGGGEEYQDGEELKSARQHIKDKDYL